MKQRPRYLLSALLVALLALPITASANSVAPTIRLFPTTVLEDIRQTGHVAEEMETGLHDAISRLDQQRQLFEDAKCDGAENDPGCDRIAKQLGARVASLDPLASDVLANIRRIAEAIAGTP